MQCGKGKEREEEWSPLGKGLKGKGRGKGRGKLPTFGQLKDKSKGKGKWFPTGKGKSAGKTHTGKGKDRVRCWKCGQHGHFEKDCKNVAGVTEESEELYDENDWTIGGHVSLAYQESSIQAILRRTPRNLGGCLSGADFMA